MAKRNKENSESGKKFPFVLLLLMSLAIGAIAVAGGIWFEYQSVKVQLTDQVSDVKKGAPTVQEPIYVPMDAFTLTLKPSAQAMGSRVLHIGFTMKLSDEESKQNLEKFLPEIRSRLLILFSQQVAEQLTADNGKHELIDEIIEVVNKPLTNNERILVTDVLLNAFILR